MKVHELKTDPDIYDAELAEQKPWMLRINDRDFKVGDIVHSRKTKYTGIEMQEGLPLIYTGEEMLVEITYIQHGPFYTVPEGTVIMAFCFLHSTSEDEY